MKPIFKYVDYRLFIRDFFLDALSRRSGLTGDGIVRRVGFTSMGFITQIIQGRRNLLKGKIRAIGLAMELPKNELRFFESLVRFDLAENFNTKSETLKTLALLVKADIKRIMIGIKAQQTFSNNPDLVDHARWPHCPYSGQKQGFRRVGCHCEVAVGMPGE